MDDRSFAGMYTWSATLNPADYTLSREVDPDAGYDADAVLRDAAIDRLREKADDLSWMPSETVIARQMERMVGCV